MLASIKTKLKATIIQPLRKFSKKDRLIEE